MQKTRCHPRIVSRWDTASHPTNQSQGHQLSISISVWHTVTRRKREEGSKHILVARHQWCWFFFSSWRSDDLSDFTLTTGYQLNHRNLHPLKRSAIFFWGKLGNIYFFSCPVCMSEVATEMSNQRGKQISIAQCGKYILLCMLLAP